MKKHRQTKTKSETSKPLHEPEPDAAGIDVGANEIWVAVAPDRTEEPVRRFGAFTRELKAIVQWLRNCGIVTVAMESTGVYWIPLYQLLADAGLKVCLVNARHVKNVPGRKSDVRDCQWLQYLHSVGLLRASYRPEQAICAARSIYRYRQNLLTQAAQHVQHMQASLDQMNIKLHHVIDDLTGITGLAIIEAILDGKRDPQQLAKLRDHRIKASEETIVKALEGDWRSEHLFVLRVAWENWKQTQHQIQKCDQQLLEYTRQFEACTTIAKPIKIVRLSPEVAGSQPVAGSSKPRRKKTSKNEPQGPWREELARFFGVDLTAIPSISVLTGITLMTELGNDLGAFKTAHHFSSWLCLCPDNETSSRIKKTEEVHSSELLRDWLQRALTDRSDDIAHYLANQRQRFFNAVVVGVYGGNPEWHAISLRKSKLFDPQDLNQRVAESLGFLALSGAENLFAIDGQHRVEGVKRFIQQLPEKQRSELQDEICTIFVAHKTSATGVQRTRRLFSTLNRTAKPVSLTEIIALDEDDIVAIVCRSLLEKHPLFQQGRVSIARQKSISPDDHRSITSLVALYQAMGIYLTQGSAKQWQRFRSTRPSEESVETYVQKAHKFWDRLAESLPELQAIIQLRQDEDIPATLRNQEDGGDVLFRPIFPPMMIRCLRTAGKKGMSESEFIKRLSRIPRRLSGPPWRGLLWDGNMITRSKNQKVAEALILWMIGVNQRSGPLRQKLAEILNRNLEDFHLPDPISSK